MIECNWIEWGVSFVSGSHLCHPATPSSTMILMIPWTRMMTLMVMLTRMMMRWRRSDPTRCESVDIVVVIIPPLSALIPSHLGLSSFSSSFALEELLSARAMRSMWVCVLCQFSLLWAMVTMGTAPIKMLQSVRHSAVFIFFAVDNLVLWRTSQNIALLPVSHCQPVWPAVDAIFCLPSSTSHKNNIFVWQSWFFDERVTDTYKLDCHIQNAYIALHKWHTYTLLNAPFIFHAVTHLPN